jgi:GH15 family glucan-1,4-alpha-glucosidase
VPWLAGYEGSLPVRIGNEAHTQIQLDVYGELMDTLHVARKFKLEAFEEAWSLQKALLQHIEKTWNQPDNGIWEVRGTPQHFTHSKIMAWVALDRAVKAVENFGLDGPIQQWRELRESIHSEVCERGFSKTKGCFTQTYGGENVDASLLLMAQLGFIAPVDRRFQATVEAIERELLLDGLVLRYRTSQTDDGLPGNEGVFLACSFWLVDAYALTGRYDDAVALFERLLRLQNDLGLYSEEYDPIARRQLGNFPQAFSHIGLINSVHNLMSHRPPAKDRIE